MKLYATVTSERASKGQGGEWLEIEVLNESQTPVANIAVYRKPWHDKVQIKTRYNATLSEPTQQNELYKGEKQKGETETRCKHGVLLKYDDCLNCDKGQ